MQQKIKQYKKDFDYSYTSGAFTTIELIKTKPNIVRCVYIHSAYKDNEHLEALCKNNNIEYIYSDKIFNIVNQKGNSFVLGIFEKYSENLNADKSHVALVNPSDMGNLGTIIRTAIGMNIEDIAIIEPCADIFNPKTVRASMGALFHVRFKIYKFFSDYQKEFPNHNIFPFMLTGKYAPEETDPCELFSLVFGNEASGLDKSFESVGTPIKIPLSKDVDSFNLSVAVGIGIYTFGRKNGLI